MTARCLPTASVESGSIELPEGYRLHHVETVESTNDEAISLALRGAPSGAIVLADRQTRGRGRLGRSWQSMPGNLHSSILLRPDCALQEASQLSLLASVALADMLAAHLPAGPDPALKWPNDVLIGKAKVAGILLESAGDRRGGLDHVIIGVGVNVAWAPEGVAYPVTSLAAEGFPSRSPKAWLVDYVRTLAVWLDRWQRQGFPVVRTAWCSRSYGLGGPIRLRTDRDEVEGRFVDLTDAGALLIERADGSRSALTAGDVVFVER